MKTQGAWQDGCIWVALDGTHIVLEHNPENKDKWLHGTISQGSAMLTLKEAENLIASLQLAVNNYKEMDNFAESDPSNK